ncbi:hypothetical protein ACIQCR_29185 [Streptomyces sp. NPDC093249]|uniref:hypothetical protein n=1 Tax=unclassified Streptomyces TaxID=2593676 RepID=UPI0037F3C031
MRRAITAGAARGKSSEAQGKGTHVRPLAARRPTALAISAVVTLGTAGPALAVAHHPSPAAERAARAPLPGTAALLDRADALGKPGSVTTPVTELVEAAPEAGPG